MGLFSSPSFSSCLHRAIRWSYYAGYGHSTKTLMIPAPGSRAAVRSDPSRPAAVKRNGGLRGSTATRAPGQRL